ncbi:PREDICTED: uncharacterized protein LOC109297077 [Gavialis gangeticus]|uniref:uncharacterized protein LOC109297077 n=1 Tax=Gavialis gangeticus TaxID=94835 RepID=UPI00092E6DE3|nr:PREDICTED: uncharacterized protein LOC109297077 [Gavialis gangeticus]
MSTLLSSSTLVPEPAMSLQDSDGDTLTSSDVSHFETESLQIKDQETQADVEQLSNLESSEYSSQVAGAELREMQTGFELTVQISPLKDNKKQQEHVTMDLPRYNPALSHILDDVTKSLDGKSHAVHLEPRAKREGDTLQPEAFSSEDEMNNLEELEQPCTGQVTAVDLDLEKIRWNSAMTRLKYEYEDNEKQRQHEEKMEQIQQQTAQRSFIQGLHDLPRLQNQHALFLYCFIFIHVIYTVRELAFYFIMRHYSFCFAIVLYFFFKKIFLDYVNKKKCS